MRIMPTNLRLNAGTLTQMHDFRQRLLDQRARGEQHCRCLLGASRNQRGNRFATHFHDEIAPAPLTDASIRAIISGGGGPASAAATHSDNSWRFFTPSTSVSISSANA